MKFSSKALMAFCDLVLAYLAFYFRILSSMPGTLSHLHPISIPSCHLP